MPQKFKQELFFRQLTGSFFLYPEQKEPILVECGIKHTFTPTQNMKLLHTMHVRQLLTASCGITARQCIIYYSDGFPSGK